MQNSMARYAFSPWKVQLKLQVLQEGPHLFNLALDVFRIHHFSLLVKLAFPVRRVDFYALHFKEQALNCIIKYHIICICLKL